MNDRDQFRFDGRVAVVTGAGRGLGRAYARLLAARGAAVVVNDVDAAPAESVVAEIAAADGAAVVDVHDVASEAGGQAVVDTAVARFGRIDIVVNNAGIIRWAGPPDVDLDNVERHLAVHVAGTFNTIRAAWPRLTAQRYGRIVNTTSSGVFGLPANLGYATAKGGVIGMTRSLATAGAAHGIRANCIAPAAQTRMAGAAGRSGDEPGWPMSSDLAAPMVAYLAHEDCPVTGEIYAAGAGRFARIFLAATPGYLHAAAGGVPPTIEDVAAQWTAINDESGYTVPGDLMAWSHDFIAHLPEAPA